MDSASKLLIKQNEQLIKSLDINVLKPHLMNSRIFTSLMLQDIFDPDSEYDLLSELPSRGPYAFSRFLQVLDVAGYRNEANKLRNCVEYGESVFYPMKSRPLGYCIIINNVNFYLNNIEVECKRREGSKVDAERLQNFFEAIGYAVEVHTNLKCEEIKESLKVLAKSEVLKMVDCCFVIMLSHGFKNDVVHDTQFSKFRKQETYDIFNNINCINLRNKPKIFLFQACRGEDGDAGANENSDSLVLSEPNHNYLIESTDTSPTVSSYGTTKIPTLNDMLVIHSSLPNYASYLDLSEGSWLVQDIVSVFRQDYRVQDLESMLKTVSRKIQGRLSRDGQKKQVLHTETFGFRALLHICSNDDYMAPNKNLISYLLS